MKIGFTGSSHGMSPRQIDSLRIILSRFRGDFHHGDCVGADAEAHKIAYSCGWNIIIHPPAIAKKRAFCSNYTRICESKEYLTRNKDIVNETEGLIVAPYTDIEEIRSGTWSTKRYAERIGKPFEILPR